MVWKSIALFKNNQNGKNYNQRMRNGYRNLNYHNFIVIIPKCNLNDKMFNYTIIDWDEVTCIELLAIRKQQFQPE
jgi:hypothetical protein